MEAERVSQWPMSLAVGGRFQTSCLLGAQRPEARDVETQRSHKEEACGEQSICSRSCKLVHFSGSGPGPVVEAVVLSASEELPAGPVLHGMFYPPDHLSLRVWGL